MDVGEHTGDLDQGVLQQLLDPLLDPGAVLNQIEPGPGQIPHVAHRLGRHQRRRHHRALSQLRQPHRVDLVRLRAARHVLGLRRIHQPHHQARGLQQIVKRAPVIRRRLHDHPLDALAPQVISQLDQRSGGRAHRPDLGHPLARHRLVRHPGAHHPARLGHIDRGDPLHDLLVLLDLNLDGLLHRFRPCPRVSTLHTGLPEGPVGVPNLTGVLIATMRNPQAGPRRQTDQRPQVPRKRRRRAGSPTHSFHAGAAPPPGTSGLTGK